MDPTGIIGGKTSGGDHTMDVRMKKQILPPTVQHGEETDLGPEMFGVGAMSSRVSALARNKRS
jgi:hypothetical protein